MGDLKGHALPGSLFLLYGLWWAVGSLGRFYTGRKEGVGYVSSATFPCPFSFGRVGAWPVESLAKVGFSLCGLLLELVLNLPHPSTGIVQHATMYFFFLLSGLVDLLMRTGVPLPPGTDFVCLILAFLVEGLLFSNHLQDREALDVHIHLLLLYLVILTSLVISIELRYRRSVLLTLTRSYLVMLQGSWFWAVGIILYGHGHPNTAWDLRGHMDGMLATIYFSWHCAAHFLILVTISVIMSRIYPAPNSAQFRNGSELPMIHLDTGYKILTSVPEED